MSETADTTTQDPAKQTSEAPPDKGEEVDYKADAQKWKALARKHEERAENLAKKATKYDELVESQKSEAQKAAERLAEAEQIAKESKIRAIRAEVAALKGVPAELLAGETEAEIEESATMLLKFRGEVRPDFGGGNRGKDVGGNRAQWTRADLKGKSPAEIEAARREGLLDRVMGKRT